MIILRESVYSHNVSDECLFPSNENVVQNETIFIVFIPLFTASLAGLFLIVVLVDRTYVRRCHGYNVCSTANTTDGHLPRLMCAAASQRHEQIKQDIHQCWFNVGPASLTLA